VANLAILVSSVLVLSCGQTDRITEVDDRYTQATTVGVSTKLPVTVKDSKSEKKDLLDGELFKAYSTNVGSSIAARQWCTITPRFHH